MADIEVYRVKMDLSGELTQIPDSQKLFGALIYMYAEDVYKRQSSGRRMNVRISASIPGPSNSG